MGAMWQFQSCSNHSEIQGVPKFTVARALASHLCGDRYRIAVKAASAPCMLRIPFVSKTMNVFQAVGSPLILTPVICSMRDRQCLVAQGGTGHANCLKGLAS